MLKKPHISPMRTSSNFKSIDGSDITTESELIGDTSGNGKIDVNDAIIIAKFLVGNVKLTPEEQKTADFNGNGRVDVNDAIGIAKYIVKNG